MLHDKNRNIVDANNLILPSISGEEKYYQELWNCFYHTIGIKERKNSHLRMQFMPKKYWQDLVEKL